MEKHDVQKRRIFYSSCKFLFLCLFTLCTLTTFAQQITVKGSVKNSQNEEIVGASVAVKGTTTGTMTNVDGAFSLQCDSKATLVVSYVGYKKQEIAVNNRTFIDITLQEDAEILDEVVVIGYGVVKKRDLTGSVASLKSGEIMKNASSNAMESMQGKIAGLDIMKESGESGSGIKMDLRGNRSIQANNGPLILVDGVEYGSTLDLNNSDIESMEVLKDGSSTAIYGSKGANGVIIITTKRGKSGATKVNFNSYLSFNSPTNLPKVMNAEQEYLFLAERARYAAEKPTGNWGSTKLSDYPADKILDTKIVAPYDKSVYQMYQEGGVNWFDMLLQNSVTQNYEIGVSGGSEKTNFNLSFGYMDENGLLRNDEMKRYNVKLVLDHNIYKNLKVGANILYTYKDWNRRQDNVYSQAIKMHTLSQPYMSDGTLMDKPSPLATSHTNPLLNEMDGYYANNTQNNRFFGNTYLDWEIIKNLRFRTALGVDQMDERKGIYEDYMCTSNYQSGKGSYFEADNANQSAFTWDNTLNYMKKIAEHHEINALLGTSTQQEITEIHGVGGYGAQEHYPKSSFYDLTNIPSNSRLIGNSYVKNTVQSYFGRLNYKYMNRYLLTGTLRADGSSVLSEGNKWDYFPSVAAAWIISEESFMKNNVDVLNNLKLRVSWGKAGNSDVKPYSSLTTLGQDKVPYTFNETLISGQVPSNMGNKDLGWEITKTWDIGLDFSLFNSRLNAVLDVYYSNTYDLLMYKALPPTSVYPQVLANVADAENKGFEAAINGRIIDTKDFQWSADLTYSINHDKITGLASGHTRDFGNPDQALEVGGPVRAFLGYKADGTWSIAEKDEAAKYGKVPGDIKIVDVTGEGAITEDDRVLFSKSPKYILGMNNTFSYKDFTLSCFLYARVGQWIKYDYNTSYKPTEQDASPAVDFWTPENQGAKFPRPGIASQSDLQALAFEKASFFKIKDLTLAYNLPKAIASQAHISNLKLYFSLKNYFTFSNLDNYDPERRGEISNPLAKQAVVGLNLEF